MLSLIKIKDIHQCEDTDRVCAIVRTSRGRPTWSVRTTWCSRAPCWWPLIFTITGFSLEGRGGSDSELW